MDKKICHLTSVHSINDVRIFLKECTSLAANGFDVTLIACGDTAFEDIKNGVKRISLCVPVTNRIQRMIKRTRAVYRKALQVNADIYHFHDPELLPVGRKLKKMRKIVVYDSHEDTAVLIKSREWIPIIIRYFLSPIYAHYETRIVRELDAIITVTPSIVEKFKKINLNTYQVTNFPIVETTTFNKQKIERKNICFAGNITPSYMLENVINSLSKTIRIKLILAGEPMSNHYLNVLKSTDGWNKVEYLGRISHGAVNALYGQTLIGIACLGYLASIGYKQGTLGVLKLFEFMNAGMAVICTDSVLWKEIIDKENCGLCVNPYEIDSIAKAIQFLVDNPKIALEMGMNGRKAVEREYNWESQEKILIELYKDISN
jgi:glycosyltransferase involved in cell wall biosynthesis